MPKKQKHKTAGEVFKFTISEPETGGFGIRIDSQDMLLPRGDVFHTPSRTYAEFVLKTLSNGGTEHFNGNKCLLCHECTLFIDFSTGFVAPKRKDFLKFQKNIAWCSTYDPINALCAGPEVVDQLARLGPFHDFCADCGIKPPNWGQGFGFGDSEKESLEEVLRVKGDGQIDPAALSYFHCIEKEFQNLSVAQKAVVFTYFTFCSGFNGSPVILPILLVKGLCTPMQFAEGFLATLCMIPGVFGDISKSDYNRELKKITRDAERAQFFLKFH
jgi:hypothetical protein